MFSPAPGCVEPTSLVGFFCDYSQVRTISSSFSICIERGVGVLASLFQGYSSDYSRRVSTGS